MRYYLKTTRGRLPVVASAGITGTSGVWTDVTPAGISLVGTDNGGDNYGCMDPLWDSSRGCFFQFTCYNGVWRSNNYGLTWVKVSTDGKLEGGKAWGEAIAQDGSYMLASCGNHATLRSMALRSTDGGATWSASANLGADPYDFDIDPTDPTHCVCTFHDSNKLFESTDSGVTWADKGAMGSSGISGYVHFLNDGNTLLQVSQQGAAEGSWRGTKSAGTWSWSLVTDLAGNEHDHGSHQIFVDVANSVIFNPGAAGVFKSTDNGVTWTKPGTQFGVAVVPTATKLYAGYSFPINSGSLDPKLQHASRPAGTTWTGDSIPGGMVNGPKRMAVATDGSRWVIVSGNWCSGIWRYVE